MNYQWRVNTMVGDERDLEDEVQSSNSHRKDHSRRPKFGSNFCRDFGIWCSQCCDRDEDSDSDSIKSDATFFKRRRRKKERRTPAREEVETEEVVVDGEVIEEHGSSVVSGPPYLSDDEEMPREKIKKHHKKHHETHRTSEDTMLKETEDPHERERDETLEIQEDAFPDPPHHHTHGHHHHHRKDHTHHRTEHKHHKEVEHREVSHCHRKPEKPKKHHKARKESDFEETCCYLCARNTKAIAAAAKKCDQCSQTSAHSFPPEKLTKETCDKSCNPITNKRTVQSSVKVKTRDRCTLCPESKKKEKAKHKSRFKKFGIFPRVKLTKCPDTRTVACGTEGCPKQEEKKKRGHKHDRCCGERKHSRF